METVIFEKLNLMRVKILVINTELISKQYMILLKQVRVNLAQLTIV